MSHICVQVKTCSGGGYTVCRFLSSATKAISCGQSRRISRDRGQGTGTGTGDRPNAHLHEVGLGKLLGQLPPPALPEARRHVAVRQPLQRRLLVPADPLQLLGAQRRGRARLAPFSLRLLGGGTGLEITREKAAAERAQPRPEQPGRHPEPEPFRAPLRPAQGGPAPHAAFSRQNSASPRPPARSNFPIGRGQNPLFPIGQRQRRGANLPSNRAARIPAKPTGRGLLWRGSSAAWGRDRSPGAPHPPGTAVPCGPPPSAPYTLSSPPSSRSPHPSPHHLLIPARLRGAAALPGGRGAEEGEQRALPDHGCSRSPEQQQRDPRGLGNLAIWRQNRRRGRGRGRGVRKGAGLRARARASAAWGTDGGGVREEGEGRGGRARAAGLSCEYRLLFGPAEADGILRRLERDVRYLKLHVFGKWHSIPRRKAVYGDPELKYTYSGVTFSPEPWIPVLDHIRERVASVTGHKFNFVLINRYKDGLDHIGEHRDDEKELVPRSPIASVSFGACRDFVFRHCESRGKNAKRRIEPVTLQLAHGSLLLMKYPTNVYWYHSLPIRKRVLSPRINLTFRKVMAIDK
uniref:DNA oxidative demethylase ALKBH2 n=1 Tax=Anas platyrhynchos platyrhynchos TaxID=8840 RepID=A0A493T4B7_ANAPP